MLSHWNPKILIRLGATLKNEIYGMSTLNKFQVRYLSLFYSVADVAETSNHVKTSPPKCKEEKTPPYSIPHVPSISFIYVRSYVANSEKSHTLGYECNWPRRRRSCRMEKKSSWGRGWSRIFWMCKSINIRSLRMNVRTQIESLANRHYILDGWLVSKASPTPTAASPSLSAI